MRLKLRAGSDKLKLKDKLRRGLWQLVWLLLFRPTPRRFGNTWRLGLLRLFGAQVSRCLIMPSCRILKPWLFTIGRDSAVADDVYLYNHGSMEIGHQVVISHGAFLCGGTHDPKDPLFRLISKPIRVGDEAWVAAEAFVHPGVTIGRGTVIGARSVVTKDMPDWMICVGNPCVPIKPRVIGLDGADEMMS